MPIYLLVIMSAFVFLSFSQASASTSLHEYQQLLNSSNITFGSHFVDANNPGVDLGPVALRLAKGKKTTQCGCGQQGCPILSP